MAYHYTSVVLVQALQPHGDVKSVKVCLYYYCFCCTLFPNDIASITRNVVEQLITVVVYLIKTHANLLLWMILQADCKLRFDHHCGIDSLVNYPWYYLNYLLRLGIVIILCKLNG